MRKVVVLLATLSLLLFACTASLVQDGTTDVAARGISASEANISVVQMSGGNITVTCDLGKQATFVKLYMSEGNGMGLVRAYESMNYVNGVYTYTFNHPTFKAGAKIKFALLINLNGESLLPQGNLADTASWKEVVYGTNYNSGGGSSSNNSTGALAQGTYYIISKSSGKAVDVDAWSTQNGGNIIQWQLGNNQANQQWKVEHLGNNIYKLQSVLSGKVLDVSEVSTATGANVHQWDWVGGDNQKWKIENNGDGTFRLTAVHSGKVLDLSSSNPNNGANIQQWTWNGTDAQRWKFVSVGGGTTTPDPIIPEQPVTPGTAQLIPLNPNMNMTFQFDNNTRGTYSNDRIWICVIGRNANGVYCYLKPDGTLVPIQANQTSEAWSFRLSDINGYQIPQEMPSARLFISMDNKVVMRGIVDGAGNIGVVQPDLNNPQDPNAHLLFDWIEYTVAPGAFWGNTTQVDQFCFPITMEMYNKSGNSYVSYRKVGITKTREEVFSSFERDVPAEFKTLVQRPYRIVAPCKGDFRVGRQYGNYMASYVNQVWDTYRTRTLEFDHPLGHFSGRVLADNRFEFTRSGDSARYYINGKPNNDELMEGSGVLAWGNSVEKAIQAQICAALNRHVLMDPANWNNASAYYKQGPANYYAKFWHDISLGGYAYGFCYDDVGDHSTLIETHSPRGMVIGIGW